MADKAISELIAASEVTDSDLFVLEQSGTAKKLSGQTLTTFLLKLAEGHGGIKNIEKTGTSGLKDTYTITMADESTNSFTVTNGEKGEKGDKTYVWLKYSNSMPTQDEDMYDTPDNYMGIYTGSNSRAPGAHTEYEWFRVKGEKGDTGTAASIEIQSVQYQVSSSGTIIPSDTWSDSVPAVSQGQYLWTRSMLKFNTGEEQISYSVSRFGLDGTGAVSSVCGVEPDADGNVPLTAESVGARSETWLPSPAEIGALADRTGIVTAPKLAEGAVTPVKLDRAYAELDENEKIKPNQIAAKVKDIEADAYTLISTDAGKFLRFTGANAKTVTVPTDASNSIFPVDTELEMWLSNGSSSLTVNLENTTDDLFIWSGGSGTSFSSTERWCLVTLKKVSANRWVARGEIA